MTPTETGLYGPGDYPADFVTIDDLPALEEAAFRMCRLDLECKYESERIIRSHRVTTLIELAHDLDARGLVLIDRIDLQRIDTADADAETGGE